MSLPFPLASDLAWPLALLLAWIAGELGYRATDLPRIVFYGLVGFVLAPGQTGFLPPVEKGTVILLANVAFGLILFELGYRINLRWLRNNPWLGVTGLVEAAVTFTAVYFVARWFGAPLLTSLLLATLSMSSSPAGILRVVNEQRSAGQVTERILHLSVFNSVLAVLAFKILIAFWLFKTSNSVGSAAWYGFAVLVVSAGLGVLMGVLVPGLLRCIGDLGRDATLAFALTVIALVAVTYFYTLSPVLAALTFGLTARHRRVALNRAQRNFGTLGDLLTVLLFVFVSATLSWKQVAAGAELALLLVVVRFIGKTGAIALFSRLTGISWRKGILTGLGMMPLSVFAVLLLEQSRHLGVHFVEQFSVLETAVLLLGVLGPVMTQLALIWANELSPLDTEPEALEETAVRTAEPEKEP